jgi:hypothetical protein
MNFFDKQRKLQEAKALSKKLKRKRYLEENREFNNAIARAKYRQKHGLPIE